MSRSRWPISDRGIPVISNFEIDDYAQELAGEFTPDCLEYAFPFDIQHFVRQKLGCRIASMRLSADGSLLGQSFFRPAVITVYREDGSPDRRVSVPANTILLDSVLLEHPGAARFTLAHEAGHMLLHDRFFLKAGEAAASMEKDRSGMSDHDWLEHQADRFAAAILMNRKISMACWEQMQDYLDAVYPRDAATANAYAEETFARHFSVSRLAARNRLEQLSLRRVQGQTRHTRPRDNDPLF